MADIIKVWLGENQLGFLGRALNMELSAISPLQRPAAATQEEVLPQLQQTGLLDSSGAVAGQYLEALRTLAKAEGFTRLRLTKGRGLFEYVLYFAGDGVSCALLTDNSGFWLEYPAQVEETAVLVRELIGASSIKNAEFEGTFDFRQGLALAAVIDLTRRAMLKTVTDNGSVFDADFRLEEIEAFTQSNSGDAQWLTTVIRGVIPGIAMDRNALETAVEGLAERGFLLKNGDKYALSENTAMAASRLLLIDKILSLRSGALKQGTVVQSGFVCLTAGVNDVLMIEVGPLSVYMEMVTSRDVCQFTELLLRQPMSVQDRNGGSPGTKEDITPIQTGQTITEESSSAPQASVTNASSPGVCVSCGTGLIEGAKFCPSCGTPVQAQPKFCSGCGAEIPAGAAFCGNCGTPVPRV